MGCAGIRASCDLQWAANGAERAALEWRQTLSVNVSRIWEKANVPCVRRVSVAIKNSFSLSREVLKKGKGSVQMTSLRLVLYKR